jgi:hypothetical protein
VFNALLLIAGILDGFPLDGPNGLSSWGLGFWCWMWRSLDRFDVVFLELSLVIDSLSLKSVWANLDGCFWWNPNLVLGWWFDDVGC